MPNVNPSILKWAREASKYSLKEAAKKLAINDGKSLTAIEKLSAYEKGAKEPSRALLKRMSSQYHRPLLTFYLEHPPVTGDRGEDFRTLPDNVKDIENARVDALIRDIKARQSIIRESLIDADEEYKLEFVSKFTFKRQIS